MYRFPFGAMASAVGGGLALARQLPPESVVVVPASTRIPNAVPVSAGQYNFQNSYRASAPTEVGGIVTYANGTTSYLYIATLPTSPSVTPPPSNLPQDAYAWQTTNLTVNVPANAVSLSVFQVLYSAGFVQTDNYSLSTGAAIPPPPPPTGAELVSNPGAETAAGTSPAGWSKDGWGTNNATFSWSTDAHTGSRSLRVDVANWTSGGWKRPDDNWRDAREPRAAWFAAHWLRCVGRW